MSADDERPWQNVSKFPDFLEHLESQGGATVSGIIDRIEADIDMDGVVYHDRGIRSPGYDATFVPEQEGARLRPAFSVELHTVGPRSVWAVFDATLSWDFYLLESAGIAAIAWVSDEEYNAEEAGMFLSKHDALAAGRFSFGTFIYAGEDWQEQRELIEGTDAPAFLQRDDGSTLVPTDQADFYNVVNSTPEDFRTNGGNAPAHLGLLELEVTID
ncbi:hypothetical protein [Natrinema salaciae]|uniref:Uncharacterized protein n=1 Tax=Natrinema salaciae TaxID=1186196 RepID=A0A1H9AVQ5_9EURY|nr:hypothetical protein [Natrinema salaciae]SEP80864.1 hypothetical protein SAMN04489841_0562 [Natrinema salaciae]